MIIATKKKVALEWFGMTDVERFKSGLPLDKQKLARHLKVGGTTIKDWEAKYYANKIGEELEASGHLTEEEVIDLNFDPEKWFQETRRERYEALLKACKTGNAQAIKLAAQLANELVEKQEITVGLSADEIARRNLEAERQLKKGGY